ncbi:hypothetical protein CAPTEDRAFT_223264 [Capitella teleta]|uniref:PDZ domain-containing protein n=1 Tax=Capitella teleta TaxID=283909 RepID=R7ULI4_CAPTE|nr:hypothetical protein CAPTEDRAFT_223264 [Capitella teleta]|eukprot:ELU07404.1 hypothetical protein CAPTEDRAFT_223264 [Capitella teleta]
MTERGAKRKRDDRDHGDDKGRLKVAVYINSGLLTVHVRQASHLSPEWSQQCNAYVKICLKPDESRRSRCHTAIVYSPSNQPVFEEKFSFELLEEDLRKRLVISVWNKDPSEQHVEFLGSMSFGLMHVHVKRKVIDGWYHLLSEDLGKRKHLKVASASEALEDDIYGDYGDVYEAHHRDHVDMAEPLVHLESHVFVIQRGYPDGFGFALSGNSPAQVSRVDLGSPADSVGLQMRDRIIRINNINVDYSTAETVGRILKNTGKEVVLEIQRPVCKSRSVPSISEDHNTYAELASQAHFPVQTVCSASSSSDLISSGPAQKRQYCAQWLSAQARVPPTTHIAELGSGGSAERSWEDLIPERKAPKEKKVKTLGCVPFRSQKLKRMGQVT